MARIISTRCSATVGIYRDRGVWTGMPEPCPWAAVGPHPDPRVGYLQPLCGRHRDAALAALAEEPTDG